MAGGTRRAERAHHRDLRRSRERREALRRRWPALLVPHAILFSAPAHILRRELSPRLRTAFAG